MREGLGGKLQNGGKIRLGLGAGTGLGVRIRATWGSGADTKSLSGLAKDKMVSSGAGKKDGTALAGEQKSLSGEAKE